MAPARESGLLQRDAAFGLVVVLVIAAVTQLFHQPRRGIAQVKRHLVGHSLGGRLMAACAKALCADPKVRPDSLLLLEAATFLAAALVHAGVLFPGYEHDGARTAWSAARAPAEPRTT